MFKIGQLVSWHHLDEPCIIINIHSNTDIQSSYHFFYDVYDLVEEKVYPMLEHTYFKEF